MDVDFFEVLTAREGDELPRIRISLGDGLMHRLGELFRANDATPGDGAWYQLDLNTEVNIS